MPTREHEMCLELIRERPALAADLLECVRSGLVPESSRARLESGDLSENAPAAYLADAVVTLGDEDPSLVVIVEVQRHPDQRKYFSWPTYLATARARLKCPAALLVICLDDGVAAWARRSIPLGHPGLVLTPLVLGPEEVPVLTGPVPGGVAPELAVISALVHGAGPDGAKVLAATVDYLDNIETERARRYLDELMAGLPETAQCVLEAMVTSGTREYKSDFARRYYSEGEASGEARGEARGEVKAIMAVLSARGIAVPEHARTRISECTDLEQLEVWVRRAATAESADDLFV